MCACKSPNFPKPSSCKLRSQRGRIPATGSGGRESKAVAEDGRLPPMADLGLPIFDGQLPICEFPHRLVWPTKVLFKVRNDPWIQEDVKNEGTSGDVYENKGKMTKCIVTNSASRTKMDQSHANRHQSGVLLGRACIGCATMRSEVGPKIGSSVPRPIVHRRSAGLVLDGPMKSMVRWPDHRSSP